MAHLALFASGVPDRLAADKPCFCLLLPLTVGPHSSVLSLPMPGTMDLTATVNEEQGEDHNQGASTQYLPWSGHELLPQNLPTNLCPSDMLAQGPCVMSTLWHQEMGPTWL